MHAAIVLLYHRCRCFEVRYARMNYLLINSIRFDCVEYLNGSITVCTPVVYSFYLSCAHFHFIYQQVSDKLCQNDRMQGSLPLKELDSG